MRRPHIGNEGAQTVWFSAGHDIPPALLRRAPGKTPVIDSNDGMANRAARAPETSLYEPVKAFLEQLGVAVKGEVCGCDIVGVRPGEPPMVVITELKMALTLELVLQGVERLRAADEVWLAVLATRRGRDRDRRAHRLCRLPGFGLLAVNPANGSVEILAEPAPYRPRPNLPQRRRLFATPEPGHVWPLDSTAHRRRGNRRQTARAGLHCPHPDLADGAGRVGQSPLTRCPPSTAITLPVMYDPASEASRSSGPSSSGIWPSRRCGTRRIRAFPASLAKKASLSSVSK